MSKVLSKKEGMLRIRIDDLETKNFALEVNSDYLIKESARLLKENTELRELAKGMYNALRIGHFSPFTKEELDEANIKASRLYEGWKEHQEVKP